jgi:hypothetical protein
MPSTVVSPSIFRFANVLSIAALRTYNLAVARFLLADGLTTSHHQRIYCAPSCLAGYKPRVHPMVI